MYSSTTNANRIRLGFTGFLLCERARNDNAALLMGTSGDRGCIKTRLLLHCPWHFRTVIADLKRLSIVHGSNGRAIQFGTESGYSAYPHASKKKDSYFFQRSFPR